MLQNTLNWWKLYWNTNSEVGAENWRTQSTPSWKKRAQGRKSLHRVNEHGISFHQLHQMCLTNTASTWEKRVSLQWWHWKRHRIWDVQWNLDNALARLILKDLLDVWHWNRVGTHTTWPRIDTEWNCLTHASHLKSYGFKLRFQGEARTCSESVLNQWTSSRRCHRKRQDEANSHDKHIVTKKLGRTHGP